MERRDADEQLLEALLEHLAGHQDAALRRRVDTVLARLQAPQPARRPGRRWLQLAALFLLSLLVYAWWPTAPTAEAVLDRALAESRQPEDRRYRVQVEREKRESLLLTLDVHGDRRCVLRGERFALGLDGQRAWFVPPLGPVLVNPRPVLIEAWLESSGAPAPFLELTSVLMRLRTRYHLELLPAEGDDRWLRGWAREDDGGPQRIELRAEGAGGVVRELKLFWQAGRSPLGLARIELHLLGRPELPAGWYRHEPHHVPDRPVLILNP